MLAAVSLLSFSIATLAKLNSIKKKEHHALVGVDSLNEDIFRKLKVTADQQYDIAGEVFIAKGNVEASIQGALLSCERLEFDRKKRNLIATGNITLIKGSQYFEGSYFQYSFIKESGQLDNVYGVIDIDTFSNDFRIINSVEELRNSDKFISKN